MSAGARGPQGAKGAFLAKAQYGRHKRKACLPSGCEPRFAWFVVRTLPTGNPGVMTAVCKRQCAVVSLDSRGNASQFQP